jgi:hypothetical protein
LPKIIFPNQSLLPASKVVAAALLLLNTKNKLWIPAAPEILAVACGNIFFFNSFYFLI